MSEGLLPLDACGDRPEAGLKARRLAQARGLGLPVPDGVVLLPGVPLDPARLQAELKRLGASCFVVRSSSQAEDQPGRSAAGLLLSVLNVPAAAVPDAVVQVRASGQSAAVRAYLGGPVPVAVLIQPQLQALRLGVLSLDADGTAWVEERAATEPEWGHTARRDLTEAADRELLHGARRLASLLGPGQGAYIEYAVLPGGRIMLLQVRPAPTPPEDAWPAPDSVHTYHLDREHNPDPLSCAQASLVELVADEAASAGLIQRVVRGHLYWARTGPPPEGSPLAELPRLRTEVWSACEAVLCPLEAEQAPALDRAISAYREVFRRYVGELGPSIRRARAHLDQFLRAHVGEGLEQHALLLGGLETLTQARLQALWELGRATGSEQQSLLSAYLRAHGALAPCWDVAVPCDEEVPDRVLAQAARVAAGPPPEKLRREAAERSMAALAELLARLPPHARAALAALLPMVRSAAALAEDDDELFFRAQRVVRRALLGQGQRLLRAGHLVEAAEVFDLPIPVLLQGPPDRSTLRASSHRLRPESPRWIPPERFEGGRPRWPAPAGVLLRGRGVPGRDPAPVQGTAQVVSALHAPPPIATGTVLVLPALLPSWAPQLLTAAALVTDSGGALSHGAILAREAGVPAVVGTGAATRLLRDGDPVLVDAARGLVCRLPRVGTTGR